MRKLLIVAAAALTTVAFASPAAAQYNYGRNSGYGYSQGRGIERQLQNAQYNVRRAVDRRSISRSEADRLMREVDRIGYLYSRYGRDGLTPWEYRDLQTRLQGVNQRLQYAGRSERWRDDRWNDGRYNDGRSWNRDDDDDNRWGRSDRDDDDDRWNRDNDDDQDRDRDRDRDDDDDGPDGN
jgi:hypothetical protein